MIIISLKKENKKIRNKRKENQKHLSIQLISKTKKLKQIYKNIYLIRIPTRHKMHSQLFYLID